MSASSPRGIAIIGVSTATTALIVYFFTKDRSKTTIIASIALIGTTLSQTLGK